MPSIKILRQKLSIASDDIPIPAGLCALANLSLAVLAAYSIKNNHDRNSSGRDDDAIMFYVVAIMVTVTVAFFIELLLCYYGCRGCIFEVSKRRAVAPLLHAHMAVYILVIACNIYASAKNIRGYSYVDKRPPDADPSAPPLPTEESWPLLQVLIHTTWGVIAFVLVITIFTRQMFPDQTRLDSWRRRFQCLFLFSNSFRRLQRRQDWQREDEPPPLDQVALVMHRLMRHLDLTYSDMLVSIKLARLRQHISRWDVIRRLQPNSSQKPACVSQLHLRIPRRAGQSTVGTVPDTNVPDGGQQVELAPDTLRKASGSSVASTRAEPRRQGVWAWADAMHANSRPLIAAAATSPTKGNGAAHEDGKSTIEINPVAPRLLTPSHMCAMLETNLTVEEVVTKTCGARVPVSLEDLEQAVQYHRMALGAYGTAMFLWQRRGKLTFLTAPCALCCGSRSSSIIQCCCRPSAEKKLELIRDRSLNHLRPSVLELEKHAPGDPRYNPIDEASGEMQTPSVSMQSTPRSRARDYQHKPQLNLRNLPRSSPAALAEMGGGSTFYDAPSRSLPEGTLWSDHVTTSFFEDVDPSHFSVLEPSQFSRPLGEGAEGRGDASTHPELDVDDMSGPMFPPSLQASQSQSDAASAAAPTAAQTPPERPPQRPLHPKSSTMPSRFGLNALSSQRGASSKRAQSAPPLQSPLRVMVPSPTGAQPGRQEPSGPPSSSNNTPLSAAGGTKKLKRPSQLRQSLKVASQLYRQALLELAGIRDQDLIYDSLKSKQCKHAPYYIALDHANKSVVITIRGTMSVEDVVTDVMCFPHPMAKWLESLPGLAQSSTTPPGQASMSPKHSHSIPTPTKTASTNSDGSVASHVSGTLDLPPTHTLAASAMPPEHHKQATPQKNNAGPSPHGYTGTPSGEQSPFESCTPTPGALHFGQTPHGVASASAGLSPEEVAQLQHPDGYGHRGIMTVAAQLIGDLERHNIIPTLLAQPLNVGESFSQSESAAQNPAPPSAEATSQPDSGTTASGASAPIGGLGPINNTPGNADRARREVEAVRHSANPPGAVAEASQLEQDSSFALDMDFADATQERASIASTTSTHINETYLFCIDAANAPSLAPDGSLPPVPPTPLSRGTPSICASPSYSGAMPDSYHDSAQGHGDALDADSRRTSMYWNDISAHILQRQSTAGSQGEVPTSLKELELAPRTDSLRSRFSSDPLPPPAPILTTADEAPPSVMVTLADMHNPHAEGGGSPTSPEGVSLSLDFGTLSSYNLSTMSGAERQRHAHGKHAGRHTHDSRSDPIRSRDIEQHTESMATSHQGTAELQSDTSLLEGVVEDALGDGIATATLAHDLAIPGRSVAPSLPDGAAAGAPTVDLQGGSGPPKESSSAITISEDALSPSRVPPFVRDIAVRETTPRGLPPKPVRPAHTPPTLLIPDLASSGSNSVRDGAQASPNGARIESAASVRDASPVGSGRPTSATSASPSALADEAGGGKGSAEPSPGGKSAQGLRIGFLKRQQKDSRSRYKHLLPEKLTGQGWRVVVTGHSMGAGVAAFVGIYLRMRFPQVPLKVYLYSCPASLMSPNIAAVADKWTVSVALGKDVVPRLTLASLEKLRDELIFASASCKWNKAHILAHSFWNALSPFNGRRNVLRRIAHASKHKMFAESLSDISPEVLQALEAYRTSVERYDEEEMAILREFRAPGKVIFLRPLPTKTPKGWELRKHDAIWIEHSELVEEGILLSRHMMIDHFPDVSYKSLLKTCERLQRQAEGNSTD